MQQSIRYRLLKKLITHMENQDWILGAMSVNPGKSRYLNEEIPGLSVFAADEDAERNTYNSQFATMRIDLSLIDRIKRHSDDEKVDIFEQIETARAKLVYAGVNVDFDDLADPPVFIGGSIEYPTTEDLVFKIGVSFEVNYETELRDPYSQ